MSIGGRRPRFGTIRKRVGEPATVTGILYSKVDAFGPLHSLQLTVNGQLENLGPTASKNAINFQSHYADGRADLDAKAVFGVSEPVTLRAWLPLTLEKDRIASGTVLDPAEQFLLKIDCPALFLETLPNEWRWKADRGLVSGGISFSNTVQAPTISGAVQVLNAKFKPTPPWPELDNLEAEIRFANTEALVDPLQFQINSTPVSLRGRSLPVRRPFSDLTPVEPAIACSSPSIGNLAGVRYSGRNERR
jgi:hypothetical protein